MKSNLNVGAPSFQKFPQKTKSTMENRTRHGGQRGSRRLEWYTNFSIEVIPLITSTGRSSRAADDDTPVVRPRPRVQAHTRDS